MRKFRGRLGSCSAKPTVHPEKSRRNDRRRAGGRTPGQTARGGGGSPPGTAAPPRPATPKATRACVPDAPGTAVGDGAADAAGAGSTARKVPGPLRHRRRSRPAGKPAAFRSPVDTIVDRRAPPAAWAQARLLDNRAPHVPALRSAAPRTRTRTFLLAEDRAVRSAATSTCPGEAANAPTRSPVSRREGSEERM